MSRVLACGTVAMGLGGQVVRGQTGTPSVRIEVPFEQVRAVLPKDGEIVFSQHGPVERTEYGEDNPYERPNPSIEISLGRGILTWNKGLGDGILDGL